MFNILDNNNSILLNKIINYIFIKQRSSTTRCTCIDRNRLTKASLENKIVYYLSDEDKIQFVSVNIIDEINNYIQILFIGYEDDKFCDNYINFLSEKYKDYHCDIVVPKENSICGFLNTNNIKNYGIDIHLELTKKNKLENDKKINVFKIKTHLIDEYKDLHNDKDRFWTSNKVLKNKAFDVIVILYNNEMIGYVDLYKSDNYYEIYDLFIIDKVKKIDIIINQIFNFIFDHYAMKRIMIVLDEKSKYMCHLTQIGFKEYDNSISYYFDL